MTDDTTDERTDRPNRRDVLKTGALATSAIIAGSGAIAATGAQEDDEDEQDEDEGDEETADEEDAPFATVEFTNQEGDGTSVTVDATTLSDPGYVAFHDTTLFDGEVAGSVIGVTDQLDPGVSYQVSADLFDVPGGEFEEETLSGTTPVIAMPHEESGGDDTYDFVESGGEEDGPIAEDGLPVVDLGFVTAAEETTDGTATPGAETATPGEETATPGEGTDTPSDGTATPDGEAAEDTVEPFATVDFENQTLDDDEVTVGEAVLSEGGFIALHDAGLLEGDAVGSVVGVSEYLEPGLHREIEVELDDPDSVAEVPFPAALPVIPMPHRDTNDNDTYDFVDSEGADDGPYTAAGQAVVDVGLVSREEEEEADTPDGDEGEEAETPDEGEDEETGTPGDDEGDGDGDGDGGMGGGDGGDGGTA